MRPIVERGKNQTKQEPKKSDKRTKKSMKLTEVAAMMDERDDSSISRSCNTADSKTMAHKINRANIYVNKA